LASCSSVGERKTFLHCHERPTGFKPAGPYSFQLTARKGRGLESSPSREKGNDLRCGKATRGRRGRGDRGLIRDWDDENATAFPRAFPLNPSSPEKEIGLSDNLAGRFRWFARSEKRKKGEAWSDIGENLAEKAVHSGRKGAI